MERSLLKAPSLPYQWMFVCCGMAAPSDVIRLGWRCSLVFCAVFQLTEQFKSLLQLLLECLRNASLERLPGRAAVSQAERRKRSASARVTPPPLCGLQKPGEQPANGRGR